MADKEPLERAAVPPRDAAPPLKAAVKPLPFVILAVVMCGLLAMMIDGTRLGHHLVAEYAPQVDAAMEIKYEALTAHLTLEELIGGDGERTLPEVLAHFEKADWYARALRHGGKSDEGTYLPLAQPGQLEVLNRIERDLERLVDAAKQRAAAPGGAGIGSAPDQRYDQIFERFLAGADEIENQILHEMESEKSAFLVRQSALIGLALLLSLLAAAVLRRHEAARAADLLAIRSANLVIERRDRLSRGQVALADAMRGRREAGELGRSVAAALCTWLGAPVGAVYITDTDGALRLAGGYGWPDGSGAAQAFAPGEGLVGQAALDGHSVTVAPLPQGYLRVVSGTGSAAVPAVAVVPFSHEGRVAGVIEVGLLAPCGEEQLEYLESVAEGVGIAFGQAETNRRLEALLAETQTQAEELQTQQEELQVSNEELSEQTRALKESEAELQAQQEELQASNEEIEERSGLLERQRDDILRKNLDLEAARAEIARKAADLEQAIRYKSEFLANMSHELRTPLNSILILSGLLEADRDGNLTGKQREFARTINASGADLLSLIDEILDLSKIEAGRMDRNVQSVPLAGIAESVRQEIEPLARHKGLALLVEIAAGLPAEIRTDPQRLRQILKNLLSNACKFTERGRVALSIGRPAADADLSRSGLPRGEAIAIAVGDTGIGIPPDQQETIFEAFRQADGSTSRKYGGTGLGLSISRELAGFLGGEIQLRSIPGEGSTFTLFLPVELRAPAVAPPESRAPATAVAPAAAPPACDEQTDGGPGRVLVVEDDDRQRASILELLSSRGLVVLPASSGGEATALIAARDFDCIVLDLGLRDTSGFDLLDSLAGREGRPLPPVIVYTGRELTAPEEERLRAHAGSIIIKGDKSPERLCAEIQLFLHREIAGRRGDRRPAPRAASRDAELGGKTVLVVDDDIRNVFAVKSVLEENGARVLASRDGRDCLAKLDADADGIDLVLMDIMLPEMDGFEAMRRIREDRRFRDLPIIALTAKAMQGDRDRCIESGASDYLAKPVDIGKLLSLLRVWLCGRD